MSSVIVMLVDCKLDNDFFNYSVASSSSFFLSFFFSGRGRVMAHLFLLSLITMPVACLL